MREVVTGNEEASLRLPVLLITAMVCMVFAPLPANVVGVVALLALSWLVVKR